MKHRFVASLALCLIIASLFGCSIFPGIGHKPVTSGTPTPLPIIYSSYQPPRILQACFDTKPLVSEPLFRAAVNRVADVLDSSVNVNEGAMQVYISYITSQSYLQDAFSFALGSLPDDPRMPALQPLPDPAKFSSPYDYATAKDAVESKNAALVSAWQLELKINHDKLAAARAVLNQNTKKLRS